ncbi:MAG: hypothetical protein K6C14_05840 [Eubacterium sp.]|nr:hypothetical protein [Eubacterium sp.]
MTYNEALNFITDKKSLGIKPGLTRIKALLCKLGDPQNCLKIIHIAGTNGKGTVAATVAEALTVSGFKTGLFTSPWVDDYREQLQIDGEYISESDFSQVINYIKEYESDCTEFELLTAAAYYYFALQQVDYAVIECGMGGTDDATNVEDKNLSVITSVSLDHTNYLGSTVEEIALAKSGILRKDCTCVLYNSELEYLFRDKCKKLTLCPVKSNLALVNLVLKELGVESVKRLKKLPARQEIIGEVMLDGGHNPSAARKLLPHLENEVAVIGMLADKDAETYLSIIAPKCNKIFATTIKSERALDASVIADIAEDYCDNVYIIEKPADAVKVNNLSLVCGSFYLIREVRKYLLGFGL